MGQFCLLGKFGSTGQFGHSSVHYPDAYSAAVIMANRWDAFAPAEVRSAACMSGCVEHEHSGLHIPAGGMTIGLLLRLLQPFPSLEEAHAYAAVRGFQSTLHNCRELVPGIGALRAMLAYPEAELRFLRWMSLGSIPHSVLGYLNNWAHHELPDDFLPAGHETGDDYGLPGPHPIMAVVNKGIRGKTFALQAELVGSLGMPALLLDLWPCRPLAAMLSTDPFQRACLEALYQLVSVGFLLRLGAPELGVQVY